MYIGKLVHMIHELNIDIIGNRNFMVLSADPAVVQNNQRALSASIPTKPTFKASLYTAQEQDPELGTVIS